MEREYKIALLGQPNSGKSTVFNMLTGSHQHVGNWPGKTVEKKEGTFTHNGKTYLAADLPGAYGLTANSDEEVVTRDYIANEDIDLVCILADSSQLERSLYMLSDFAGIDLPVMLLLTMADVAEEQGKHTDPEKLSEKLGISVVSLTAPDKNCYDGFYSALEENIKNPKTLKTDELFKILSIGEKKDEFAKAIETADGGENARFSKEWLAVKLMEGDRLISEKLSAKADSTADGSLYTSDCKFAWIEELLSDTVTKTAGASAVLTKFDRIAISKRWGKWVSLGIILLGLVGSMVIAMPAMGIGQGLPAVLRPVIDGLGLPEFLSSLINNVLITPLGWAVSMVGFVLGVSFVFGLIEEVGFMARISYCFDNTMNALGLQGKSVMPMLVSFGCTMGGMAGSRVIDSWGQRLLTITLSWAIPCSATFVVIPTLANAVFGGVGGILVMLLIFGVMFLHLFVTAKIWGRTLSPAKERTGLIMELPPYHKPRWKNLILTTLGKVWDVFKKAITVIVLVAFVFWLLSYSSGGSPNGSILYKFGVAIEPVTKFFGMGWQTFTAFVASMVSKEAVLGVTSVLFADGGSIVNGSMGGTAANAEIGAIIAASISKAEALAFIIAVTFNVPCMMAVASTYQETHSVKWTLKIAAYYVATALILSCLTYHISGLFLT
ncbi:MAG: ferrous iron transport protein B [Ruminococcus sp.]|nr:ferrous iron transport protein B [Ruminococcus sp.]